MNKNVSLVLSGGGARGIAHIGAIEELEKRGYHIQSVSGTSMGALVGGVYVLGKMKEYKNWLYTLDKIKVFQLIDFTLSMQGFIKGTKVMSKMKDFIPDRNIEDLEVAYTATAVDILHHEEIVFDRGSIYNAIRASIAIPTVFTPVKWQEKLLVDGGVLNNIPIKHVRRNEGDILVVVNVNADIPVVNPFPNRQEKEEKESIYQKKIKEFYGHLNLTKSKSEPKSKKDSIGYFDLINKTIHLMTSQMDRLTLKHYKPDVLINVSGNTCGTFDFFKAEQLVEIGRLAAVQALEKHEGK